MSLFGDGLIFFFEAAATKTSGPRRRMEQANRKEVKKNIKICHGVGCDVRKEVKFDCVVCYKIHKE